MHLWKRLVGIIAAGVLLLASIFGGIPAQAADLIQTGDLRHTIIWETDAPEDAGNGIAYAAQESTSETLTVNCGYMYYMLETDGERSFYDRLLSACQRVESSSKTYTVTPYVSYTGLSTDLAMEVAWIFYYDHPEFFWMNPEMHIYSRGIAFSVVEDYQSASARSAAKTAIFDVVESYLTDAQQYDSDYDKALYFYETLRQNVTYSSGSSDQTIASVFLEQQTVCAGYSKAFALLCNASGVDAVTLNSCSHGWNVVCLSGHWYVVDVTNGYWLLSDAEMQAADIATGITYVVTYTDADGEETTVTYYAHDIYLEQYPVYASQFPVCDASYSESGETGDLIGDVNGDGSCTLADTVLLQKYLLGSAVLTKAQAALADVYSDGTVNGLDLSLLRQQLLAAA